MIKKAVSYILTFKLFLNAKTQSMPAGCIYCMNNFNNGFNLILSKIIR